MRLIPAIFLLVTLLLQVPAYAGQMFLEHRGELARGYSFFRGPFDLGDINHDGAEEMVIADDEGGFHVYRYTEDGFVPIWISDPLIEDGYIIDVQILHEDLIGFHPRMLMLDSMGTLHQIAYNGYLYEETATYEDYSMAGESGRLVLRDMGGGGRTIIIALPEMADTSLEHEVESDGEESTDTPVDEPDEWSGMTLYRLSSDGLVKLTENEITELDDAEIYFVQELTSRDIAQLHDFSSDPANIDPDSHILTDRVGVADLDRDAFLELLVSVSDPEQPIDRLEIYSEESGEFTVRITLELPLINEMVLGDVDGDNFSEIVGLTFDGEVLVYQYDPLTVMKPDGTQIEWLYPHRRFGGLIWVDPMGFESLGCIVVDDDGITKLLYNNRVVELDTSNQVITCDTVVLLPDLPGEAVEDILYVPLLATLDCLGFHYTYDSGQCLVEVGNQR